MLMDIDDSESGSEEDNDDTSSSDLTPEKGGPYKDKDQNLKQNPE